MTDSKDSYQELSAKLGIAEKDIPLLRQAFIHRSYCHENGGDSNERLEFLGDSVLSLTISEYLYKNYPQKSEGELSKWRASLVNSEKLATIARTLDLGKFLLLGTGEERSGGRERSSLLADVMEALIAVVYLVSGIEKAREFVIELWHPHIEALRDSKRPLDAKTMLQEILQRKGETPKYELIDVTGPDHERHFTSAVYYRNKAIGVGTGRSKKEAEKKAARKALLEIEEGK